MRIYRYFVFTVFLCLIFLVQDKSYCQFYYLQKYNVDNGLRSRIIYDAAQDSTGLIWFATNYGVSVYDGYEFNNFEGDEDLPLVSYRKIKTDAFGTVWALPLSAYDTIMYYKNDKWNRLLTINSSLNISPDAFTSFDILTKNKETRILAGSYHALYYYSNGKWTILKNSVNNHYDNVRNIFSDGDIFYICSEGGLYTFNGSDLDYSLAGITKGRPVCAGFAERIPGSSTKIWILEYNRIGYIENGNYKLFNKTFKIPDYLTLFYFTLSVSGNYVFHGTDWGKYLIDKSTGESKVLSGKNGFTTEGATSVLFDREDNIWITDTRGVDKFRKLDVESFNSFNGLLESEITTIAERNNGELVFGHNEGISKYDEKKFRHIEFRNNKNFVVHSSRVNDMCTDEEGNVWIAASRMGLGKYSKDGTLVWYKSPEFLNSVGVLCDKQGNIFTITSDGLFILKENKFSLYLPKSEFEKSYRKIYEIDDAYYVIGLSGIFRIKEKKVTGYKYPNKKLPPSVFTLFRNSDKKILAGATDGIYEISGDSLIKSSEFNITSPVYAIKQDNKNNLWIGTNNGVLKYSGKGLFKKYSKINGLAGNEINRSAIITDKSGNVWVGTEGGVSKFHENVETIPVPKLILNYVTDNKGRQYMLAESNEIDYEANTLHFSFRGISYLNEKLMTYRLKLDGADKDWITLTQNEIGDIKYTNLDPGEYRLLVSVKNEGGDWSGVYSSGQIFIQKPLYLKWWFILFITALALFILTVLTNYRTVQRYNLKLNREIEVKKIIERALRESEEKYRAVVEQTKEGIVLYDIETLYIKETNSSYEKMLGYTKDEMRELTIYDIVDDSKDNIDSLLQIIIREGSYFSVNDRFHIRKDGSKIPVEVYITLIEYLGKKLMCVLIRDITERKSNEAALKEKNEELAKAIASKDKFFSILAHDLKSPFQGLMGYSELLARNYSNFSDDEKKRFAADMNKVSRNLFQLVNNLLQWSQLQTKRMKYFPEYFSIHDLIQTAAYAFEANFEQKNISFNNNINPDVEIYADKMMTEIIFRNLISNAVKFSKSGGVIKVYSETKSEYEWISICDEGVGIPKEIIPKLFEITTKYSTKGTDDEDGTGLGLVLCSEMAQLNKGKISVESTWGKGSVFTVILPKIEVS